MKVFICLLVAISAVSAGVLAPAAIISTGTSTQTRAQDGLGNYNFAYAEQHPTGGSSRSESGNALGQVVGHYTLNAADGRQRRVNYVADALGFRAAIATNEPGTKAQAAASTSISAPGLVAAAPVVAAPAIAAPVLAAPAYAAPIATPLAAPIAAPIAYTSSINHAAFAAPLAAPAIAAPVLAAPAW